LGAFLSHISFSSPPLFLPNNWLLFSVSLFTNSSKLRPNIFSRTHRHRPTARFRCLRSSDPFILGWVLASFFSTFKDRVLYPVSNPHDLTQAVCMRFGHSISSSPPPTSPFPPQSFFALPGLFSRDRWILFPCATPPMQYGAPSFAENAEGPPDFNGCFSS